MKISISGELGSGKTVLSKNLSEAFGLEIISIGKVQRKLASEKGMTTLEFNKYIESNPATDNKLDNIISDYGRTNNSYIFDSRLAWNFVPDSFKIHLLVDADIATKRVFNDEDRVSEAYKDLNTAKTELIERKQSERKRFWKQYKVDINNFNNYDLIIDTTYASPKTIFKTCIAAINKLKKNEKFNSIWLCPKTLIPMQGIREHSIEYTKDIVESIKSKGFSEDFPVFFLKHLGNYFIFDGHKRTSSSILSKIELIPCIEIAKVDFLEVMGVSIEKYIESNYLLRDIYDWEAMNQFNYPSYLNIKQ